MICENDPYWGSVLNAENVPEKIVSQRCLTQLMRTILIKNVKMEKCKERLCVGYVSYRVSKSEGSDLVKLRQWSKPRSPRGMRNPMNRGLLELVSLLMHPNERLGRVILTASWFNNINMGYVFHINAFFLPEASIGLHFVVACVCPSVRPSVTKIVRTITLAPFKLGSQNWDHRCKGPWLRSLLFFRVIDLDFQGQI